jgi:hypothetical protein
MASRIVPEGGHRLKPFRTPRVKNRRHLDFIKRLPCICCLVEGREIQADDPMHIRAGSAWYGKEPAGAGETSDDRWTLPGCRPHHDQQHRESELVFWGFFAVDPFGLALVLWGLTGDHHAALAVLRERARGTGHRATGESGITHHGGPHGRDGTL